MFEATNQSSIFSSQNSISMVYTMNCPIMFPILSYIFPIMFPSFSHQVPTKNIVFRCLAPIFLLVLSREWEWSINSISTSIITILIIIPFPHSLLSTSKFFHGFSPALWPPSCRRWPETRCVPRSPNAPGAKPPGRRPSGADAPRKRHKGPGRIHPWFSR